MDRLPYSRQKLMPQSEGIVERFDAISVSFQ
jgi:hypothetical protein